MFSGKGKAGSNSSSRAVVPPIYQVYDPDKPQRHPRDSPLWAPQSASTIPNLIDCPHRPQWLPGRIPGVTQAHPERCPTTTHFVSRVRKKIYLRLEKCYIENIFIKGIIYISHKGKTFGKVHFLIDFPDCHKVPKKFFFVLKKHDLIDLFYKMRN